VVESLVAHHDVGHRPENGERQPEPAQDHHEDGGQRHLLGGPATARPLGPVIVIVVLVLPVVMPVVAVVPPTGGVPGVAVVPPAVVVSVVATVVVVLVTMGHGSPEGTNGRSGPPSQSYAVRGRSNALRTSAWPRTTTAQTPNGKITKLHTPIRATVAIAMTAA